MTIAQAKLLLKGSTKQLNDEQVQSVIDQVYAIADVVVNVATEYGSTRQPKVIDSVNKGVDNGN